LQSVWTIKADEADGFLVGGPTMKLIGAPSTPFDAVWNTPDVANFGLVFLRDNTDFRASYFVPEVCGSIVYIDGLSLSNRWGILTGTTK
jgi:hypothetical protein